MQDKTPEESSEIKSSISSNKVEFQIAINEHDLSILNGQDPSLSNSFKIKK